MRDNVDRRLLEAWAQVAIAPAENRLAQGLFKLALDACEFEAGDDLAERIQEANGGRLADRVIVATGSMTANQQALEVSGPGSTVILMGVTGPDDTVQVPTLSSLIQDKTIRFSLWYPFQWPKTIGILAHNELDTGPIITHSAELDGIGAAIERVVNREEGVLKTVIKP